MSNPLDTIFKREFAAFSTAPQYTTSFDIKVILHVKNKDYRAVMVTGLSVNKDFFNNYADEVILTASFTVADCVHVIYPYKTELEITVIKTPLTNYREYKVNNAGKPRIMRYSAKLTNEASKLLESNTQDIDVIPGGRRPDDYLTLGFQLLDPLVDKIRNKTIGGSFYKNKAIDVIKAVMTKETNSGVEGELAIKGVTVAPGFSTQIRDHIIVSHLTKLVDFPALVNKKAGGVYKKGFKYYLTNKQWYIYAPFDGDCYTSSEDKLTIINTTKDKLSDMEITTRFTPTQTFVLAAGETRDIANMESMIQNKGIGVRFVDASRIMDYGMVANNRLFVQGSVKTAKVGDPDGKKRNIEIINESDVKITSAYNLEQSKLAERLGNIITLVWESSDDRGIYPGMPVRFMYLDKRIARAVYGTVIGCHTQYMQSNTNPRERKFKSNSILTLFLSGDAKDDKQM